MRTFVWLLAGLAVLGTVGLVAAQTLDTATATASDTGTSAPAAVPHGHGGHACPLNATAQPASASSSAPA